MAGEWMNNVAVYLLDFINYGIGIIVILIIYQIWKFVTFGSGGEEATLGDAAEKVKNFKKDYGKLRRALKKEYKFDTKLLDKVDDLEKAVQNNDAAKEAKILGEMEKITEESQKMDAFINEVLQDAPAGTLKTQLESLKNMVKLQLANQVPAALRAVGNAGNQAAKLGEVRGLKTILSNLRANVLGIEAVVDKIRG